MKPLVFSPLLYQLSYLAPRYFVLDSGFAGMTRPLGISVEKREARIISEPPGPKKPGQRYLETLYWRQRIHPAQANDASISATPSRCTP